MKSIRAKLLLGLLLPLIIVAAFVSLETFYSSQKISSDLNDKTLLAASFTILERVISTNGNLLAEETLETLTQSLGDRFFYHVSGPSAAFVTGYSGYPRPPNKTSLVSNKPVFYDGVHLGVPVRVVRIERELLDRELSGVTAITTWQHVTQRRGLTISLFGRSLTRLFLLVFSAGAIVWFALQYGLNPIVKLQAAIDRRTPQDLTPIKRSMPQELSGIVGSMNDLFARVARSKNNRERFIGDAAHQLRNPIAAIKVQAETALMSKDTASMKSGLQQIVDVSNASTGMINKMLSSARAHAMDRSQEKLFDLSLLLQQVVRDAAPNAFAQGHEIALMGCDHKTVYRGNETLIKEAVSNLIDNAIHYNKVGSQIEVALRGLGETLEIAVADTGKAFDDEQFIQLTQPFYTGDGEKAGSGLGLSIAKDISKSHGGHLVTNATTLGKEIVIVLPVE